MGGVVKMGNGNTSGLEDGTEKSASASASASECDVGLGLRMQHTESFPSRTMMETPHPPLPYHHLNADASLSDSMGGVGFGGDGGSSGSGSGGPIYYNLSNNNQLACLSDIYDVVGDASVSGGAAAALVVPRTFHPFASDSFFKSSSSGRGGGGGGGGMEAPAKVPFTASQRQELERQTNIYKYIMASIPVPPELLLPITKSPSPLPSSHSQSNMSGLDLKFSRSSDPEPWRCRRTDGKKWRCSRDVAPYQKYCERHAHKTRPRSRKPVELQPHNTQTNSNTTNTHPLVNLSTTNKTAHPYQKPIFHIPTLLSGATHAQPRCTEWFMKGDPIPSGNLNQQWQQLMQSSSSGEGGLKSYNEDEHNNRNVSVFQQHYEEEQRRQQSMNANSYIDMEDGQRFQNKPPNEHCSSSLLGGLLNTNQTQTTTSTTTRRFIDAWSSAEGEEIDHEISKCSVPSTRRNLPLSSLTLSMSGADNRIEESANDQMGVSGMIRDLERESESGDGGFKSQWLLNPVPWMGSPPGGPLGEALCLGIASTAKAASNVPSPHDYSTTTTTTSSCSKSSCDDSGHGLHFH
ncbi:unnamed protein product [Camellia sinensis]